MRRGFTLIEMLVAIVVLLAVIIATAKIFGVASDVSSAGEATADVTQQGSVLRDQMQRDLSRLSRDGFVAIQCVAVRNDVRRIISGNADAPLLVPDPPLNLSPTELQQLLAAAGNDEARAYDLARARYVLRCDQLVFFTGGSEQSARWAGPADLASTGGGQRARAARIYYGHGVQFPQLTNDPRNGGEDPLSISLNEKPAVAGVLNGPALGGRHVTPWTYAPSGYLQLAWGTGALAGAPRIPATQPEAREWTLARRSVLLADDGGSPWYYPDMRNAKNPGWSGVQPDASSAPSIFGDRQQPSTLSLQPYVMEFRNRDWAPISRNLVPSPMIQSGWVDIAASDLDAIRRTIIPTLPLQDDLVVWQPQQPPPVPGGGAWRVSSLVPPWAGWDASSDPGPLGWPGGSAAPFPTGAAIASAGQPNIGDSASGAVGAVGIYTTQRDRILRGCFGTPADGSAPGTVGPAANVFAGLLGWPRAERVVANLNRRTEVALSPTILSNCSSFRVDWTWAPGVGETVSATGQYLGVTDRPVLTNVGPLGVDVIGNFVAEMSGFQPWVQVAPGAGSPGNQPVGPIPWFGFPDDGSPDGTVVPLEAQRLGATLAQDRIDAAIPDEPPFQAENLHMSVVARQVEGHRSPSGTGAFAQHPAVTAPFGATVPVRVYSAVFGFNSAQPAATREGDVFTGYLDSFDGKLNGQPSGTPDGALSTAEWVNTTENFNGIAGSYFAQLDVDGDGIVTRTEYEGREATRVLRDDFTPWPSQLRITATLHDPRLTLGRGREIQFVLEVPNRGSK